MLDDSTLSTNRRPPIYYKNVNTANLYQNPNSLTQKGLAFTRTHNTFVKVTSSIPPGSSPKISSTPFQFGLPKIISKSAKSSKMEGLGNQEQKLDVKEDAKDTAKIRIEKMRHNMGCMTHKNKISAKMDLWDPAYFTATLEADTTPEVRDRVLRTAFQLTHSPLLQQSTPQGPIAITAETVPKNSEDEDKRRDSADMTVHVDSLPALPAASPFNQSAGFDLLGISLVFIQRAPHSSTCKLCEGKFQWGEQGLKMLGCGHWLHAGCFKETGEECTKELGDEGALSMFEMGKCNTCSSFWAQVKVLGREEWATRLRSWEDSKFSWRRSFGWTSRPELGGQLNYWASS